MSCRVVCLTPLWCIDDRRDTVGPLPFTVVGLDFHLDLRCRGDVEVSVDVASRLGVGHRGPPPVIVLMRLERHHVATLLPIVILRLDGLWKQLPWQWNSILEPEHTLTTREH